MCHNCRAKFVLTVKLCLYQLVHREFDIGRNSYPANYIMLLSFFSQFVSVVFSSGIFIKIRSFQNFSEATRPEKPYPPPPTPTPAIQIMLSGCCRVIEVDFIQVFLSFEVNSVLDAKDWAVDQTEATKIAYFEQFSSKLRLFFNFSFLGMSFLLLNSPDPH